ncbi:hypothetical protein VKT23_006122 [Stygiomarasmius scandens]|uniref:pectinesterase n=1 Tax=Marasmiellus scandens TaxID=2682957 RepID=A0ABR1JRY0_9AGAR
MRLAIELLVPLFLSQVQILFALSPRFFPCQIQKSQGKSALEGCPSGTIFVSQSTDDPDRNFGSIQEAVESLPDEGEAFILIAEGEYNEAVNVTRSGPLTLLGQLPSSLSDSQSIPFYPSSATGNSTLPKNLVTVWDNKFVQVQGQEDDAATAVLSVAPNFAGALIGAGPTGAPLQPEFGDVNFKAYNIDWENRAANFAISQALVTDISYANASFYGCSFASFQDTWYTGRNASTYVVDSVIYGQTDYLFGFGTAWFQNIILANRACGGGIVAWKGTNLTDAPGNRYGAYIADSRIIRSPDANASVTLDCFLGRPWNDLAVTVFLNTFMEDIIQPAGWTPFGSDRPVIMNTTFYAEFNSTGPGGDTSDRIPLEHILTAEEASNFTLDKVFLENPDWIDFEYLF